MTQELGGSVFAGEYCRLSHLILVSVSFCLAYGVAGIHMAVVFTGERPLAQLIFRKSVAEPDSMAHEAIPAAAT